ncbi:MAG: UDP-3-O-(3-hydroxymyristoyl)glucosamine N-acyltransferase, partial [Bradyrhizobium sp.]|nr:UDP-3-O-(3-hydroxymyristoyl)glucosamine N-acyltransferase [Bradyrhizobium sp.]
MAQLVGNPRFFACTGPHPIALVAATIGCKAPASDVLLSGLAALDDAGPEQVSFLASPRHAAALKATQAGAVLVHSEMASRVPPSSVPLVTTDPAAGWARVAALFHPMPAIEPGIHPSAVVAASARIDPSSEICAHVVIGAGADIGAGCRIDAGAVIGRGVMLGPNCWIGAHASISHALLGARVQVYPGAR